jgi:LacI family transcriptional regulator
VDEFEGAFKAVEHLIKKGCTRIAHISGPDNLSVSVNRLNGYIHALEHYKLKVEDKLILHCKSFEDDALKAINKLIKLDPMPDGIFFINDLSAIIGIRCLRKHNIRVPEDVKIVGFNDDPVSKIIDPPLTTVMQPSYEVGKLAMGILIDEIENKVSSKKTITLRTKLIVRKSSR